MTVHVIGGGGHGKDIFTDLMENDLAGQWFDDDTEWKREGSPCPAIVGINDSRMRALVVERHERKLSVTHRFNMGLGVWIHSAAHVGPDVQIGEHVHINAGVTVTRTTIGKFTTVSPGANICGDVKIGEGVTIGAGATICQFVTVGDGATIGAGAVIPPHTIVPAGETWVGVPARPVR